MAGDFKYLLRDLGPAAREFYRRLDQKRLSTTFCARCEQFQFPPRERCPRCDAEVEWRALSGRGTVYAFTQQERGLRFRTPDVIGVVQLEEGVRVFGVLDAPFESIAIDEPVQANLREDPDGLTLLAFTLRLE